MNTKLRNTLFIVASIILLGWFIINFLTEDYDSNYSQEKNFSESYYDYVEYNKTIELFFQENSTGCKLNGEIYIEDYLLGKSTNGVFYLTEQDYNSYFTENSTLSIRGITDDCFGKNSNLPFFKFWTVPSLEYYFYYGEVVPFIEIFDPRRPLYLEEIQGFIRPEEVGDYLDKLENYFKDHTLIENFDKLASYGIMYRFDSIIYNQDYWLTPAETLEKGYGDCEDWAVTSLSLMRAYNSSIKCYNIIWQTHMSIFCYLDGKYIIYDQKKTKFQTRLKSDLTELEKKAELRKMRNSYFKDFGLRVKDRKIHALINEEEIISFKEDEEFIKWMLELE